MLEWLNDRAWLKYEPIISWPKIPWFSEPRNLVYFFKSLNDLVKTYTRYTRVSVWFLKRYTYISWLFNAFLKAKDNIVEVDHFTSYSSLLFFNS